MTDSNSNMADGQETKKEGGPDWELAEAIKLMGEAQASGDPEQIATAMRRHAEALTNATNAIMVPTLQRVLETVVKKEVGALQTHIFNSDRARLDWNTRFREELKDTLDGHAKVLDDDVKRLAASVEGAVSLAGKAVTLAEDAQVRVDALTGVVSDQGEKLDSFVDSFGSRLLVVEVTPGTYPDLLRGQKRLERRVNLLLIGFGSFMLVIAVAILLQWVRGS